MNTFLSVNSQLTAQPHVFAPFDGPRRVCTRYEKFEERGHAHLLSITSIRHEKLFQVFTFDIDVHCGPRYAINSEESDAPSVTKMALGVTINSFKSLPAREGHVAKNKGVSRDHTRGVDIYIPKNERKYDLL